MEMETLNILNIEKEYTLSHSVRVAEYSMEIAKRAGKTVKEQEKIYYMGLMHDIGKIAIPDDIINKPGKLTEEEYSAIKEHTVIGAAILKNIFEDSGIEKGARSHHERYDGMGYPDGLRREEIPEEARIIGIADAYDAMSTDRSYRKALSWETTKEELHKGMGNQFDPHFAKIMIKIMEEKNETKSAGKIETE